MKLFITRHGETDCNVNHIISGTVEAMLTVTGKNQAKELAERLVKDKEKNNIKTIYVSPLLRARKTAEYIEKALGLAAIVDNRIKEIDFGKFEGTKWPSEEFLKIRDNPFVRFPEGESLAIGAHRAYSLIEEVKTKHKHDDGNVLFVCHGLITAVMLTYFKNISQEEFHELRIGNCDLFEFDLF
ncbi:MAG: histidine phosphatase family protein [Treponema sp.]|nr:MAG: histidine phosphatase family protein [Treponema sp.]